MRRKWFTGDPDFLSELEAIAARRKPVLTDAEREKLARGGEVKAKDVPQWHGPTAGEVKR